MVLKQILPLECQIPSLRIAVQEGMTPQKNARHCFSKLEVLDENSLMHNIDSNVAKLVCLDTIIKADYNDGQKPPL